MAAGLLMLLISAGGASARDADPGPPDRTSFTTSAAVEDESVRVEFQRREFKKKSFVASAVESDLITMTQKKERCGYAGVYIGVVRSCDFLECTIGSHSGRWHAVYRWQEIKESHRRVGSTQRLADECVLDNPPKPSLHSMV
ncbi:MAG: hypothetical protein ACRDRT_19240, partial [Pseudonocardiaceae bacterium]